MKMRNKCHQGHPLGRKNSHAIILALTAAIMLTLTACGGEAGTRVGNPPSTSESFPSELAVASPTESEEGESNLVRDLSSSSRSFATRDALEDEVAAILAGDAIEDCDFDPDGLIREGADAGCYGPEVTFQNHPDGTLPNAGTLPPGDVGMWNEEDEGGEACAAAQLNGRMAGVSGKLHAALSGLASMICVMKVGNIDFAAQGTDLTLTEQMADMSAATGMDNTFEEAVIRYDTTDAGDTEYSYRLVFNHDIGPENAAVTVLLTHTPALAGDGSYQGVLSYHFTQANQTVEDCSAEDSTMAGSLVYQKDGDGNTGLLADSAVFCGADVVPFTAAGTIVASDAFDATDNTDGWIEDYDRFMATYAADGAGDYAYLWQAGVTDGYTRAFNMTLDDIGGDVLSGTAFFGFGEDISETEGSIAGFICNWAGPGSTRTLRSFAQRQNIAQTATGGVFLSDPDDLALTYAPSNSCEYSGTGSFRFDSDGDGTIDTNAATPVGNELLPLTDADGDGIPDEIEESGFALPDSPA